VCRLAALCKTWTTPLGLPLGKAHYSFGIYLWLIRWARGFEPWYRYV